MRIGGLFEGYGGLTQAARAVFGGELAWVSEYEPPSKATPRPTQAAARLLAHRQPNVPNLGDITAIDWPNVEPVDLVTAGYPCQPFSSAGKRGGTEDDRYLWPCVADCLAVVRPRWFVGENVRNHLNLGFDQAVRDLDLLGYDVHWRIVRAAEVGAPHERARLFILGRDRGGRLRSWPSGRRGLHRSRPHEGGGLLRDPRGGRDGHEVDPDLDPDEGGVGWAPERNEARDRPQRSEDPVGSGGRRGGAIPSGDRAVPGAQDAASLDLSRPASSDHEESRTEGAAPLVSGSSSDGGDREAASDGAERPGSTAGPACAAGGAPARGEAMGRLVGAGRVPVRSGALHEQLPDQREHESRACVRDTSGRDPFALAWPAGADPTELGRGPARRDDRVRVAGRVAESAADAASERRREGRAEPARVEWRPDVAERGVLAAADTDSVEPERRRVGGVVDGSSGSEPREGLQRERAGDAARDGGAAALEWGEYAPAIARWGRVLGRPAPVPTQTGKRGGQQLSPRFVEWLMGLPEGWVTDGPGLTRNEQLKLLGNGVVPQQAQYALRLLLAQVANGSAVAA